MNKNAFEDLTLEEEVDEEEEFKDGQGFEEEEKKEESEEEVEFKYDRALYDPDELNDEEEPDFDDDDVWTELLTNLIKSIESVNLRPKLHYRKTLILNN